MAALSAGIAVTLSFTEPSSGPSSFDEPANMNSVGGLADLIGAPNSTAEASTTLFNFLRKIDSTPASTSLLVAAGRLAALIGTSTPDSGSGATLFKYLKKLDDAVGKNNFYGQQRYTVYGDRNCTNNNGTSDSACAAGDAEYTGEESTWASSTDTSLGGALVASGLVKRDMRTGQYWSDCYSSASGDGTCDGASNGSTIGTGCTDADINGGLCDSSDFQTKGSAVTICENLSLDANGDGTNETDWRLPTQKELMMGHIDGAANNLAHTNDGGFWSATELYNAAGTFWYMDQSVGDLYYWAGGSGSFYVRCVHW